MISDASIFRAASLLTARQGADIVIEVAGLLDLLLDPNDDRRQIGDALARATGGKPICKPSSSASASMKDWRGCRAKSSAASSMAR